MDRGEGPIQNRCRRTSTAESDYIPRGLGEWAVETNPDSPNFNPRAPGARPGRRRRYALTLLGGGRRRTYPRVQYHNADVVYFSSESLVFTVVPWEKPNEFGFSEIAWTSLGNIRLWGALAFSIAEGQGFYSFEPLDSLDMYLGQLDNLPLLVRAAERLAGKHPPQSDLLHWQPPKEQEIEALYVALQRADNVLLRGVNCYLKSHLLWDHYLFMEEMGINLYISLEAGLSVLRQRLSQKAGRSVPFVTVFDFVREHFAYGDALAEYWQDAHDDRNALLHPANDFSPYAIQPMSADDILELFDPMLSLYRYLLIGDPRPAALR